METKYSLGLIPILVKGIFVFSFWVRKAQSLSRLPLSLCASRAAARGLVVREQSFSLPHSLHALKIRKLR